MIFYIIFQILIADSRHINPPKPGFYGVKNVNEKFEFVEIEKSEGFLRHLKDDNTEITAWNFQLVPDSKQITTVLNQGRCGGCWAFASADVAGASQFLNDGTNEVMSPQYEIDCGNCYDFEGYRYCQAACEGGYPLFALQDIQKRGSVTNDCKSFKGYQKTCTPKCDNGSDAIYYGDSDFKYFFAYHESLAFIRALVTTSGPCITEMTVYDDFSSYRGGVYQHSPSAHPGEGHAVTIYGFGTENGKNYWLIKNSWGPEWGDQGFVKIRMGVNESGIEQNVYSLYNNLDKGAYSIPMPKQTTPGAYWNDTYHYSSNPTKNSFRSLMYIIPLALVGAFILVFTVICVCRYCCNKKASYSRVSSHTTPSTSSRGVRLGSGGSSSRGGYSLGSGGVGNSSNSNGSSRNSSNSNNSSSNNVAYGPNFSSNPPNNNAYYGIVPPGAGVASGAVVGPMVGPNNTYGYGPNGYAQYDYYGGGYPYGGGGGGGNNGPYGAGGGGGGDGYGYDGYGYGNGGGSGYGYDPSNEQQQQCYDNSNNSKNNNNNNNTGTNNTRGNNNNSSNPRKGGDGKFGYIPPDISQLSSENNTNNEQQQHSPARVPPQAASAAASVLMSTSPPTATATATSTAAMAIANTNTNTNTNANADAANGSSTSANGNANMNTNANDSGDAAGRSVGGNAAIQMREFYRKKY